MNTELTSCRFVRSLFAVAALALALTGCSGGGGGGGGSGGGGQAAAKAITSFALTGMAGIIDETNKTIVVTMPPGAIVTALVPTFTATGASVTVGASTQSSGVTANDFSNPVVYTVTASDGTTADYTVSVAAVSTSGVVSQLKSINVGSMSSHVMVVKNDNTVWSWGMNDACQVGPQISCATNNLGQVIANAVTTPTQVAVLGTNFAFVTPGWKQSFAYGPSVYTYAWGSNLYGVLGDGTTTFRSSPVSTSPAASSRLLRRLSFTVAVRADGTLWGWGSMLYRLRSFPTAPTILVPASSQCCGRTACDCAENGRHRVDLGLLELPMGQLGRTVQADVHGQRDRCRNARPDSHRRYACVGGRSHRLCHEDRWHALGLGR